MWSAINHAGCIVMHHPGAFAPRRCPRPATHAGLLLFEQPSGRCAVYLVFACDQDAGALIAARPLLERDVAELDRRRRTHTVEPLAVGRQARELVARAQAWAARHPG